MGQRHQPEGRLWLTAADRPLLRTLLDGLPDADRQRVSQLLADDTAGNEEDRAPRA